MNHQLPREEYNQKPKKKLALIVIINAEADMQLTFTLKLVSSFHREEMLLTLAMKYQNQ